MKVPSFCLGDWSYVDVQEYLKRSDTILIPKASLEQHGPHLPLMCDANIATEIARRAGEKAGICYTPTLWLGYSPQHLRAPGWGAGTITLRAETYLNVLYDIGRSLIHHGFKRLIFVNDHGSNPIEIGAVVVWRVDDCAKAVFQIDNYADFVGAQTESALRHIAGRHPYDFDEAGGHPGSGEHTSPEQAATRTLSSSWPRRRRTSGTVDARWMRSAGSPLS